MANARLPNRKARIRCRIMHQAPYADAQNIVTRMTISSAAPRIVVIDFDTSLTVAGSMSPSSKEQSSSFNSLGGSTSLTASLEDPRYHSNREKIEVSMSLLGGWSPGRLWRDAASGRPI